MLGSGLPGPVGQPQRSLVKGPSAASRPPSQMRRPERLAHHRDEMGFLSTRTVMLRRRGASEGPGAWGAEAAGCASDRKTLATGKLAFGLQLHARPPSYGREIVTTRSQQLQKGGS